MTVMDVQGGDSDGDGDSYGNGVVVAEVTTSDNGEKYINFKRI